jgi:hypothetical protein
MSEEPTPYVCGSKRPTREELDALEREMAYDGAVANITSHCGWSQRDPNHVGEWWDIAMPEHTDVEDLISRSTRYLELRGLLVRHPTAPTWVKILPLDGRHPAG